MKVIRKSDDVRLIDHINSFVVETGRIAIWWLGQSGFCIKQGDLTIYLDPYFSTFLETLTADVPEIRHIRMMESPIDPNEVTCADYIICSHAHYDHLDPETVMPILAANPRAKLIMPVASVGFAQTAGISEDRILTVDAGEKRQFGGVKLTAFAEKHNDFDYVDGLSLIHI